MLQSISKTENQNWNF